MPKVQFLSHSSFLVETDSKTLLIDPFFTGNPKAQVKPGDIKPDYLLLTHGHGDHLGDGLTIAKDSGATVIAPNELAVYCANQGCKVHPMHLGGAHDFDFGRVKLTIAHHGSAIESGDGGWIYTGNPCGFLITSEGKTLYHAGDTGLFMDMKLIGELDSIDLALLPIGDNFTMGVDDAIKAVEFLKPKHVVPMHYDTFDLIAADPKKFASGAEKHGAKATIMGIGDTLEY